MNVVPRGTGTQIVEQRINSELTLFIAEVACLATPRSALPIYFFAGPPPQFDCPFYLSLVFLDSLTFPPASWWCHTDLFIYPALAACSAASASPSMYFLLSALVLFLVFL